MSWENYGKGKLNWQIDHIIPINYFNLENLLDQQLCYHYTNLQPLWWKDNNQKSDKILPEHKYLIT